MASDHLLRHCDRVLYVGGPAVARWHRDRLPGSDSAEYWHVHGARTAAAVEKFYPARYFAVTTEEALLFQSAQIVIDDGGAADAATYLNVADGWRV